ncbi:MAG: hypothetical protein ACXAC7_16050, partial [Candidatus Hodarchaeales archaeon]
HDIGRSTTIIRKDKFTQNDLEITDLGISSEEVFDEELKIVDLSQDLDSVRPKSIVSTEHETTDQDIIPPVEAPLYKTSVEDQLTLESEFISVSEIYNEFEEDLDDLEIQDSIPLSFQVNDIINTGDFELLSQDIDKETGSVIYTWKKNKLQGGQKARIEYVLQRRIHRSVIMYSKEQMFLVNSYHSIEELEELSLISIEFENTQKDTLEFVLIEDTIPQELRVVKYFPQEKYRPLQYQTKEGLLYRWIIENISPKEKITIKYELAKRPFTRWFERNFAFNGVDQLIVEKIAEPCIEMLDTQYLLFYELKPELNFETGQIVLKDEIPQQAELISSYPVWFRPSIEVENNRRWLIWHNLKLEGKTRRVCVRLKTDGPYNPQEPIILFEKYSTGRDRIQNEEKISGEIIDLRKKMGFVVMKRIVK